MISKRLIDPFSCRLILSVSILSPLTSVLGSEILTDCVQDFSQTQGEAGWYYGFYTPPFTPNTFQQLELFGTDINRKIGWMHSIKHPPWTYLTAREAHPAAQPDTEVPFEWAVRRWKSTVSKTVKITGFIGMADGATPSPRFDGVTGYIFVDGKQVYSQPLAQNDRNGASFSFATPVSVGSLVDFAVSPNNYDSRDATLFYAAISAESSPQQFPTLLFAWATVASFLALGALVALFLLLWLRKRAGS